MKYSENEIAKFKKAIKNAPIIDGRANYYEGLGDQNLLGNIFGEVDFDNDALNELKNDISNNDDGILFSTKKIYQAMEGHGGSLNTHH